jgi:hydroxypyruvate isomerase
MPRFAANLSMMYNEHAFLDRFGAAARDGFKAVEFLFPYDFPPSEIKAQLTDNGLKQVLFNAPRATGPAVNAASPRCRDVRKSSSAAWRLLSTMPLRSTTTGFM